MTRPRGALGRSILIGILVGVLVFALGWGAVTLGLDTNRPGGSDAPNSGGAGPASTSPPAPKGKLPKTDPRLARFYDQHTHWRRCGTDLCMSYLVPLDYDHPSKRAIRIAAVDVPAEGKAVGSLVVNPGGPGGSGLQYAEAGASVWPQTLLEHFNIIGFDPRGVGESTPLKCMDTKQTDAYIAADPDPATSAARDRMDRMVHAFGEACLRRSGDLARFMSTREVAKDMDILRQLLGQAKLDYFGASYGTFIGSTYANIFPTHVGRMVLDGAIDPALSSEQLNLAQAKGFEVAFRSYAANCISLGGCPLGTTVAAASARMRSVLESLDAHPLRTPSGRMLTEGNATLGVFMPLYVKTYWPMLTTALKSLIQDHNGTQLLQLADYYTSRGPAGYTSNEFQVLQAVNCLDHDDTIPTSQVPAYLARFRQASPTFGDVFAYSLSACSTWPIQSHQVSHAMRAQGAPPIVVIGTTRDPATPLAWAQGLARELASGVLIVRNGDGHTGYNRGSPCVDTAVNAYLIDGKVPKNGLRCS